MCFEFSKEDRKRTGSLLGGGLELVCAVLLFKNNESRGVQVSFGKYFPQTSFD